MGAPVYTGVDIGHDSIKVVSVRARRGGFQVLGAGYARLPADTAEGDDAVEVHARVLKRLIREHRIPVGRVVMGLPGKGSLIRHVTVPMAPPWKLKMLMAYQVDEHSGAAGEVAYDYRILKLPTENEGEFDIMLALAQLDPITRRMETARRAGRAAAEVDLQSAGVHNLYAVSPQCDEEEVTAVIDIGAEETNISLQRGGALYFLRSVSGGARRFTNRIGRELSLEDDAAEELKHSSTRIIPKRPKDDADDDLVDPEAERLSRACEVEANAVIAAVNGSLNFFKQQTGLKSLPLDRMLLTGGGSMLEGLPEYMASRIGKPCDILDVAKALPDVTRRAEVAFTGEHAAHFAAAAGLAVSRARDEAVCFNIIPEAEKERRRFWERSVYVGYAGVLAAALMVVIVLSTLRADARTRLDIQAKTKHVQESSAEYDRFQEALAKNTHLGKRVAALHRRAESGMDILFTLDILQDAVPEDIILTRLSTEKMEADETPDAPATGRPGRHGRRRIRNETEDAAEPVEDETPEGRTVYIDGYLLNPGTENKAIEILNRVVEAIRAAPVPNARDGMFSSVRIFSGELIDTVDEVASLREKLFADPVTGREGLAPDVSKLYDFRIECVVAEEG